MSYDILVFDPAHAPSEREAFLEWWAGRDDWSEPHPHNDPEFTTPKLRAWFFDEPEGMFAGKLKRPFVRSLLVEPDGDIDHVVADAVIGTSLIARNGIWPVESGEALDHDGPSHLCWILRHASFRHGLVAIEGKIVSARPASRGRSL